MYSIIFYLHNLTINILYFYNIFNVQEMTESRGKLPIFAAKNELLHQICNNEVVIVCGETGSGKTTQVIALLKGCKRQCFDVSDACSL